MVVAPGSVVELDDELDDEVLPVGSVVSVVLEESVVLVVVSPSTVVAVSSALVVVVAGAVVGVGLVSTDSLERLGASSDSESDFDVWAWALAAAREPIPPRASESLSGDRERSGGGLLGRLFHTRGGDRGRFGSQGLQGQGRGYPQGCHRRQRQGQEEARPSGRLSALIQSHGAS